MATITYIIGNGLDLSAGLRTSYRDFYEYVAAQKLHIENRIYKAIESGPESWADFESALGDYTKYLDTFPESKVDAEMLKLNEEIEEIRDDLGSYLEEQEVSSDSKAHELQISHTGYLSELPQGQPERVVEALGTGRIAFEFVTLNYTDTLETILNNSRSLLSSNGINLGRPHHIHGNLQENLTLGVSDASQLSSKRLSGNEKDDLIKPSLIRSMNDNRIATLERMITNSSIIVLFGTSIGPTDKYIWELVTQWLSLVRQRLVIIHNHDSTFTNSVRRSSRLRKQFDSNAQERLLRYAQLDGDGIAELKSRTLVAHNATGLFHD